VVRTDRRSLRFILDQRLTAIPQHQWVSKLLGFDFVVEYKPGTLNVVADALSRRDEMTGELLALSAPQFSLFDDIRQEINGDTALSQLRDAIRGGAKDGQWSVVDGLLFKGRVYVAASSSSRRAILELVHGVGHEGVPKTLHRLCADFHFPTDRRVVQDFVRSCAVCQRNKTEHLQPGGLLQPLGVPSAVWEDVAMDFVEALPKVNGESVILTVVDRFSKVAHFIPLGHPYTATSVAHTFFAEIVRLHGIPASIVSDRDPVFTSEFWRELFRLAGVKLQMLSAFHPRSDGQSEATNKIIDMYLRCLTGDRPRQWLEWLPWAEFCYNSSYQQAIKTSPFELVYGRPPPSVRSYTPGEARLPAVERALKDRDEFLAEVKDRLEQAQQHYKAVYDRSHRPVEFVPGQWVWLRLLHRPVASLQVTGRGKLGPKFFGPYQVLQRVGDVAYKLSLPAGARIHDVFHVGLLKPFHGDPPEQLPVLPPLQNGRVLVAPEKVLKGRIARGRQQLLVRWKGAPAAESAWVELEDFVQQYPDFQLEDELLLQGGRDVMYGSTFGRRQRGKGSRDKQSS
jgi:transposase InsO family protein